MSSTSRSYSLSTIQGFSLLLIVIVSLTILSPSVKGFSDAHDPNRVSIGPSTEEGNHHSSASSMSDNGLYVAFISVASNLVANDTNSQHDVFLYNKSTNNVTRISMGSGGAEADGASAEPFISADGRYIAYSSSASNLVANDTNGVPDIFLYDTQTTTTTRVSVDSNGVEGDGPSSLPSISANGRYIAYHSAATNLVTSDTNVRIDVFLYDTQTATTTRVSVDGNGVEGNNISWKSSISRDGNFIAYLSNASNLISGDTNGAGDVFLYNRQTNTTTRVSVTSSGTQATGPSPSVFSPGRRPSLSSDGQYIAFGSHLTTIVAGDNNGSQDIFVHNTQTATTTRVSVDSNGIEGVAPSDQPVISADGRYIAFRSAATNLVVNDTNAWQDIFLYDTQTATTTRVSVDSNGVEGDRVGESPSMSSDGRYIAYSASASNLVANDTNGVPDIFLYDTQTTTTTRVSVATILTEGNNASQKSSISADGRYVAFASYASNLINNDTNDYYDIFVHDTQNAVTTRVSVDSNGVEGVNPSGTGASVNTIDSPSMSSDGRYIAFSTDANNIVSGDTDGYPDIFVHDTLSGTTTIVSTDSNGIKGNGASQKPSISADGRYVAFASYADNLINNDTNGPSVADIFVHDRQTGITTRVSVSSIGVQGDNTSDTPSISADGRYVAFQSDATTLISNDTNASQDIFIHDRQTGTTTRVSVDSGGAEANNTSYNASLSSDGRYIAFASDANNLVDNDTNAATDIFVYDTQTATTTRVSVDSNDTQSNGSSTKASISSNGRYVAYSSVATNLDMMATLGLTISRTTPQIYIRDTSTDTTRLVSAKSLGLYPDAGAEDPSLSADGQIMAWTTTATDLVDNDTNALSDIYITSSYINTSTPIVSNISLSFFLGTTGSIISLTGTSIANEQISLITKQYNISGVIVRADIYTGVVDNGGIWSIPIILDSISGSIEIITSLYDTITNSNTSRKAGPSAFYSFTPLLVAAQPSVVITSTSSNTTNISTIPIVITFSEEVSGFVASDITITNGSISNFTIVSGSVYTFNLIPTSAGVITIDITGGVATSNFGGNNTAAVQLVRTYVIPSSPTTNGGGGGGSSSLSPDICPDGIDKSISYYDGQCDIKDHISTPSNSTITITSGGNKPIITSDCYYSDGEIPSQQGVYKNILLSRYKEDIMQLFNMCIIQGSNKSTYSPWKRVTRAEILKIILRSERILPKDFNQNADKYKGKVRWTAYKEAARREKSIRRIVYRRSNESMDTMASKNDISLLLYAINPTKYNTINLSGKGGLSRGELAHIVAAHLD